MPTKKPLFSNTPQAHEQDYFQELLDRVEREHHVPTIESLSGIGGTGQSEGFNRALISRRTKEREDSLAGLERAILRHAPKGSEFSPIWSNDLSPTENPRDVYMARARERSPMSMLSGDWPAFFESMQELSAQNEGRPVGIGQGVAFGDYSGPDSLGIGSIANDPTSTYNTNQVGPRPWGTGAGSMQALGRAAAPKAKTPFVDTGERADFYNSRRQRATNDVARKYPGAS